MVGGVVQLAIQFPVLRRIGVMPHIGLLPGEDPRGLGASRRRPRAARQMAPALVGVSVACRSRS